MQPEKYEMNDNMPQININIRVKIKYFSLFLINVLMTEIMQLKG